MSPTRKRLLLAASLLLFIVAAALAGTTGILWLRERPLRQAEAALERGEPHQALTLVEGFLEEQPESDRGLALKARVLVALGQWSHAADLFEVAGASTPAELREWATALMHEQRWTEALGVLQRLLELRPDDPDTLERITACNVNLSHFNEAAESAERLAALPGHEVTGNFLLGAVYNVMGNKASACEAWQRVLDSNPQLQGLRHVFGEPVTPEEFLTEFGGVLLIEGRSSEAVEVLQRACVGDPTTVALVQLGEAYWQEGQRRRATEQWLRAVAAEPDNYAARVSLARAALEQVQPEEALQWLAPILRRDDLDSRVAYLTERAYTLLGDAERAAEWHSRTTELRDLERRRDVLRQAAQQNPNSFLANLVQAHGLAEQGNWTEAERLLEPLLAQAPGDAFLRDLADAVRSRGRVPLPSLDRIAPTDVE